MTTRPPVRILDAVHGDRVLNAQDVAQLFPDSNLTGDQTVLGNFSVTGDLAVTGDSMYTGDMDVVGSVTVSVGLEAVSLHATGAATGNFSAGNLTVTVVDGIVTNIA